MYQAELKQQILYPNHNGDLELEDRPLKDGQKQAKHCLHLCSESVWVVPASR